MPYANTRPSLYYERRGNGPPMLCITGFGISCAVFEPVLDLYSSRLDCIAYDNRGSGRTAAPLHTTSIPELAADGIALLDALEIGSAHVYGVSMGGMIAQELALRFPDRVRGLILGCTSPGGPLAARPTLRDLRRLGQPATRELLDPVDGWLAALLFSRPFRHQQPERVRALLELFTRRRPPLRGVSSHWWASFFHDTVSRLPQIQAPTLVLHGELDAMAPLANARMLAARIPDAELKIVRSAGHAYALERPAESFQLLCDWLDPLEPIAPGPPRTGALAAAEPLTRALGLPVGMARTGLSLVELARGRR
ncbi:MAG TPA: alpha/beta fold hydrolase [Solirubrobacteraceae bacterium]|nr:alpha/beta fold hydrolase [Solirubrobacteraceae bacterium]